MIYIYDIRESNSASSSRRWVHNEVWGFYVSEEYTNHLQSENINKSKENGSDDMNRDYKEVDKTQLIDEDILV